MPFNNKIINEERSNTIGSNSDYLVNGESLIKTIWKDESSRPTLRTLNEWKSKGYLPFYRIGGRVYYSPAKVRKALEKQFEIKELNL